MRTTESLPFSGMGGVQRDDGMTQTQSVVDALVPPSVPAIRLAGLHKTYGDTHAVAGVDLDIAAGIR